MHVGGGAEGLLRKGPEQRLVDLVAGDQERRQQPRLRGEAAAEGVCGMWVDAGQGFI